MAIYLQINISPTFYIADDWKYNKEAIKISEHNIFIHSWNVVESITKPEASQFVRFYKLPESPTKKQDFEGFAKRWLKQVEGKLKLSLKQQNSIIKALFNPSRYQLIKQFAS